MSPRARSSSSSAISTVNRTGPFAVSIVSCSVSTAASPDAPTLVSDSD
jgi:hypothetical protein